MNLEKRKKDKNQSVNSMTKQQKICLLLALEIKCIFNRWKGKNDPKIGSHTYKIRAANGRTYKINRVHIRKNLGQKLNKTTYDDHTCMPFFTNDSNLDDLATANNNAPSNEENTCQRPTRTRRPPSKLREYGCLLILMFL